MISFFISLSPIYQALIAGMFTFFVTSFGASFVLFFRFVNKMIMDTMLSISAGIMLAASYFSLLAPAIEIATKLRFKVWLIIFLGFMAGGFLLYIGDKIIHLFLNDENESFYNMKRCVMLFSSITLHNIPEGLVIGVAFGSIPYHLNSASIISAITLTIGIAIQNFPEGSAISLPLRREGFSRWGSFLFGALSGIVEPIAAIFGALLVLKIQYVLPFILAFTAGAMIFVISMELIPECQKNEKNGLMTLFVMCGFSIMMILELLLG